MKQIKITSLIFMFFITSLSSAQNKQAFFAWLFGGGSPVYAGGYSNKNSRLDITSAYTLNGSIIYNDKYLELPTFEISKSLIKSNSDNQQYDLYDKKLKKIIINNFKNQDLKFERIPYENGYLYREIIDTLGIVIYDDNLDFENFEVLSNSLIIKYKDEFFNVPRNPKKRQKLIEKTVNEDNIKDFLNQWLHKNT